MTGLFWQNSNSSQGHAFWNDPTIILYILIGFLVADSLWAAYLLVREILAVSACRTEPELLRPYLTEGTFLRMRSHKLHESCLSIVNILIFVMLIGCLEMYFGFYAFLWDIASKMAKFNWMKNEFVQSVVYMLLLSIYFTLKSLPCNLYDAFCIPKLHKKKTEADKGMLIRYCAFVIQIAVSMLLMCVMILVIVYIAQKLDRYGFVAMFVLATAFIGVVILLTPIIIDPIMGQRVPLENTALKKDLERLTDAVGFPMERVYVIRMHDENSGSNAFFFGSCCMKRIIIFESLIQGTAPSAPGAPVPGLTNAQVVAVVAHELGHWHYFHFFLSIFIFELYLMLCWFLYGVCYGHGPIYQAVGFKPGIEPMLAGLLIIFNMVLLPIMTVSNFITLCFSRCFEYQADHFAFELGYGRDLGQALLKLYADNLSFPISDRIYSQWHHTHPTMMDRLERINTLYARSAK